MNVFFILATIDYDCKNISFLNLCEIHFSIFRERTCVSVKENANLARRSLLYRIWRFLFKLAPNVYNVDDFLCLFGGSIHIGNLSLYGYNAMMWAWVWKQNQYWFFRPPHVVIWGASKGFNLGRLFVSPDGTPSHPKAKHFYGQNQRY